MTRDLLFMFNRVLKWRCKNLLKISDRLLRGVNFEQTQSAKAGRQSRATNRRTRRSALHVCRLLWRATRCRRRKTVAVTQLVGTERFWLRWAISQVCSVSNRARDRAIHLDPLCALAACVSHVGYGFTQNSIERETNCLSLCLSVHQTRRQGLPAVPR